MKITVHVTQYHIDTGVRNCCGKCPVALAIASAVGHYQFIVGTADIVLLDPITGRDIIRATLPQIARSFVYWFDWKGKSNCHISPFSFELTL